MVIKAQSPAGFAEEYIIESIWNNRFPPGTILPAERELSELIGVTRTTLREVLQRLARDGWLTIQHGKPTRVNNFRAQHSRDAGAAGSGKISAADRSVALGSHQHQWHLLAGRREEQSGAGLGAIGPVGCVG